MSTEKMHENVNIRSVVDRVMKVSGLRQKDIASQLFETTDTNFSNKIKRESVDVFVIARWAIDENVDLQWLFTGYGRQEDEMSGDTAESIRELIAMVRERDEKIADLEAELKGYSEMEGHPQEDEAESL